MLLAWRSSSDVVAKEERSEAWLATPLILTMIRSHSDALDMHRVGQVTGRAGFLSRMEVGMLEHVTKRESRWRIFWPDVDDMHGAQEAITLGYWASFVVAALTTVVALLGVMSADLSALVDAVIFALVGLGLLRRWRSAGIIGLLLFTGNLLFAFSQGSGIGVLAVFIFVGLLNGVRGTFAYKKLTAQRYESRSNPSTPITREVEQESSEMR